MVFVSNILTALNLLVLVDELLAMNGKKNIITVLMFRYSYQYSYGETEIRSDKYKRTLKQLLNIRGTAEVV